MFLLYGTIHSTPHDYYCYHFFTSCQILLDCNLEMNYYWAAGTIRKPLLEILKIILKLK